MCLVNYGPIDFKMNDKVGIMFWGLLQVISGEDPPSLRLRIELEAFVVCLPPLPIFLFPPLPPFTLLLLFTLKMPQPDSLPHSGYHFQCIVSYFPLRTTLETMCF